LNGKKLSATQTVQVRSVEPARLMAWANDEQQRRLHSDVAVEDLPPQQRADQTDRLLTAIRIPGRSPTVGIIGFSAFQEDEQLPLTDPDLIKFAKRAGADYVVVTCSYGGKANKVTLFPMMSAFSASGTVYGSGMSTAAVTTSGNSTAFVPITMQKDVFEHMAVFVRRMRPCTSLARISARIRSDSW
jgi:hypothetical protein